MEPTVELAFTYASDLAKQLITLATGVLALSVTFLKDVVRAGQQPHTHVPLGTLKVAWLLLFLSVIGGIWTLSALTGSLAPVSEAYPGELGTNVRIPAGVQVLAFLAGVAALIRFGWAALHEKEDVRSV